MRIKATCATPPLNAQIIELDQDLPAGSTSIHSTMTAVAVTMTPPNTYLCWQNRHHQLDLSCQQQPWLHFPLHLHLSRTEVVTLSVPDHVTMGKSCDQTGSKPSRDSSRDRAPKKVLTLSDKESEDKEREHAWMHAYFCRRSLCYVHDRY